MDYKYFELPTAFRGYLRKRDMTALEKLGTFLVAPSQNVLYADDGTVKHRGGYSLYGAANTALTPIRASYDWNSSNGTELNIRQYDDELEVYSGAAWRRIVQDDNTLTTWSTTAIMRFAEYWDTTEKEDLLLIVDGTANIFEWSGGIATFASATATTITKEGSGTWKASRFLTAGTRKVLIGTTVYTYTGGETTTALTGVTPDPTAGGHTAGDYVTQCARKTAFTSFTLPSDFANTDTKNLIAVLDNQVWLGSTTSRYVHVSRINNFKSYTNTGGSGSRLPGEGATLTLDAVLVGFAVQEDVGNTTQSAMYMTAGKDYWYQAVFTKSADLTKENIDVKRLKTSPLSAAVSQELIAKVGNEIIFVSNEPTLISLGRVENVENPQFRNLSDSVKTDFDEASFTNGHLKYHRTLLYLALPAKSKVFLYNVKEGFWEAPQILPARRIAIIGGGIYFHSSAVPETYKLFDGKNDNTNPIDAKAYFNYQNYGDRFELKKFNEFATEGYIASNAVLTLVLKYDFGGFTTIRQYSIRGSDAQILFSTTTDGSIGKNPIGNQPIGSITDTIDDLSKFRVIHKTTPTNFFELQVGYESNDIDFDWKILAFGPNVVKADAEPAKIKK